MSYTNLKITEKCIKCGSCLGCGVDFLSASRDGSIIVKEGTMLKANSVELKMLTEICPVNAFKITESKSLTRQDFVSEFEKLKNYVVKYPGRRDLKFNKAEYSISIPVASGERRYDYSSDSAANSAAEREFNSKMYSQIDVILLKIITEYRVKYVKTYYTKGDGNFFAKCNQQVSKLLERLENILKNNKLANDLPMNFSKVDIYPENDTYWKMLNKGQILSDEMISTIRRDFDSGSYSSLSSYDYWDTDYMEKADGKDWRGNIRFREKYCYRNMHKAFQELAKDLLNSCGYVDDKLEDRAMEIVNALIDEYNRLLKNALDSKIAYLNKKIALIPAGNRSVQLEKYENIIRRVGYSSENGFWVNDQTIQNATEVYITECSKCQFFYDGTAIKMKYISNGIICNKILFSDRNFDYGCICGYNGFILFVDYVDNRNRPLYVYDSNRETLTVLDTNLTRCYFKNEYLIYVTTSDINNYHRYAWHSINCCKIDGTGKRRICSPSGGMVFIDKITDTELTYSTLQDSKKKTIVWNGDSVSRW